MSRRFSPSLFRPIGGTSHVVRWASSPSVVARRTGSPAYIPILPALGIIDAAFPALRAEHHRPESALCPPRQSAASARASVRQAPDKHFDAPHTSFDDGSTPEQPPPRTKPRLPTDDPSQTWTATLLPHYRFGKTPQNYTVGEKVPEGRMRGLAQPQSSLPSDFVPTSSTKSLGVQGWTKATPPA
jgi:hypothetical protein